MEARYAEKEIRSLLGSNSKTKCFSHLFSTLASCLLDVYTSIATYFYRSLCFDYVLRILYQFLVIMSYRVESESFFFFWSHLQLQLHASWSTDCSLTTSGRFKFFDLVGYVPLWVMKFLFFFFFFHFLTENCASFQQYFLASELVVDYKSPRSRLIVANLEGFWWLYTELSITAWCIVPSQERGASVQYKNRGQEGL